jgi:alkylresorcinol/alkylpyrone synthase
LSAAGLLDGKQTLYAATLGRSKVIEMYINGIGTAVPEHRYSQRECWETLSTSAQYGHLQARSQAILRKVLTADNGIQTRHLGMSTLQEAFEISPDVLHHRYVRHAPALAHQAAIRALSHAAIQPAQIDAVLISTCTGYLCPGLTSYVIESLDLPKTVLPLDFVGQGCAAALPNLIAAQALLESGRYRHVLSICVEVCSAAFYLDDDPGVLISACLFGDGAGAAVLSTRPGTARAIAFDCSGSLIDPNERDTLRFEQKNGMLRNILMPAVPKLAARSVSKVLRDVESKTRIRREEISAWILHPGGRDVLLEIGRELQLKPEQLEPSAAILRRYGNLSSPSVFFVLEEALKTSVPPGHWWMSAFGAGFACYGAMLKTE